MRFLSTDLPGVVIVQGDPQGDERGTFMRTYCAETFAAHGLPPLGVQCNVSRNARKGTLRGLHFQAQPLPDAKLVRCTRGRVFDVAVDVRPGSPTLGRWTATELDEASGRALFIPGGFAHGFLTLTDDAELFYMMGASYAPDLARGVRWDDPDIAIAWPAAPEVLSDRDRALPLLAGLVDP